ALPTPSPAAHARLWLLPVQRHVRAPPLAHGRAPPTSARGRQCGVVSACVGLSAMQLCPRGMLTRGCRLGV
ncbi:unnamed protein product, partial [Musa textilis]